jgi:hypothetical protein
MNNDFNGGVAARVEDLTRVDSGDARGRHTCDELHQLGPRKQCCFALTTFPIGKSLWARIIWLT